MAEAVVSIVLKTIGDLLLEEGKFFLGVEDRVKALQTRLKEIKCFLRDASTKQHKSETLSNWIAMIRDLAYRAEELVLEYAVQSSLNGRRVPTPRILTRSYAIRQLGYEISEIISEIERVMKNIQDYGIRSIIDGALAEMSATNNNQNWRRTFPNFLMEDCFIGMENELKQLVSLVIDDKRHQVISVWGMGGIGKTTIAKKVYNQMIKAKKCFFDCFAWVCVTQQCQISSILEDLLGQLSRHSISNVTHMQLIEQLCEIQRTKRCLIILDDLWETSHWDDLKHALYVRDSKSKILITTRKQNVAEIGTPIQLGMLNVDDAWELLKHKAFSRDIIPGLALEEIKLQKIGKEMVQKCGCLPLAISLLGGILSKKKSIREWQLVKENIGASLYRVQWYDGSHNQINEVLTLSYEDLPYYLKLCFLYLGVFKEDETIRAAELYRMWIAQGMVSCENVQGMEVSCMDIAELYLSELASRSLVQVEVDYGMPTKKFKSCKLHDVVRDLCLAMGQKEYYNVKTMNYEGGRLSGLLNDAFSRIKTRHLAIHFKTQLQVERCDEDLREEGNIRHLRSLHLNGRTRIEFPPLSIIDFHKFKSLRSLAFVRFKFLKGKLPKGITDLVHLRNLCLRQCELDKLPSSLNNLLYLDTLDLLISRNIQIPNSLNKMLQLKHLLLPRYDKDKIGDYRLTLDEGLEELESLMGFNSSVHKLSCVARMKNLQRFSAYIYDNESFSFILGAITNWNKLVNCVIEVNKGCEVTSSEIKQVFTCPNLHSMGMYVQLGNLLTECKNDIIGSNLGSLYLADSEIEEDPMDILGKLASLTELSLRTNSFVGKDMTCRALSFPVLRILKLIKLPNLREWRVEEGAMPLLSELYLDECPQVEKVPEGLSSIFTLKELTVRRMPELANRVFANGDGGGGGGGEDFHTVQHVHSIVII